MIRYTGPGFAHISAPGSAWRVVREARSLWRVSPVHGSGPAFRFRTKAQACAHAEVMAYSAA